LSACASSQPVPRRESGFIVGTQGAGSEVVFSGVQIAAANPVGTSLAYARRDASLNIRDPISAFDYDAWPQAPMPSLDEARRLTTPFTSNVYLYFNVSRYRHETGPCPYWP
jgi:hypothetical protein